MTGAGVCLTAVEAPTERSAAGAAKRTVDIVCAVLLLVVLLPVMGAVALAVIARTGRPVLFRQERVGRNGRRFRMAKFRTMVPDAERLAEQLWTQTCDPSWLLLERDPRVTRIGRVLRRLSLDELPQLWHVARGDMSLVGPRPLSVADDAKVPRWARQRTDVRPGITGAWQVAGRTALSFEEMLELDVRYVREWSLARDVVLLARTVPAVLSARGAN